MATFVSVSKDDIGKQNWNKNSFNKMNSIVDNSSNRSIECKKKNKKKLVNKISYLQQNQAFLLSESKLRI